MHIVVVPILGIILVIQLQCIEANLSLDFKVTKISASPANCNVANTTYAHGETFKLDCKTQCVCENGRHACSSLCPKEQLPAPEDTISCRAPRLVEVPGHCCKMWLCENPTADVYATCHNSSTSPWTPCSQPCGLGISTRFTATTAGCNQLINLRLCENRKCEAAADSDNNNNIARSNDDRGDDELAVNNGNYLARGKAKHHKKYEETHLHQHPEHHKHRTKKGHECRHVERLGPARIRLGQCVSRKLYRPKVCGHCYHKTKCCVPSVSTTIQVELLCPLNAADPISLLQQQQLSDGNAQQRPQHHHEEIYGAPSLTSLWDTHSLDAIDQEYFQSHQIHIENKFIAIEWVLKCECSENESCRRTVKAAPHPHRGNNSHISNPGAADVVSGYADTNVGGYADVDVDVNVDVDVDVDDNDNSNNGNFNNINMHNDNSNNNSNNNNNVQKEKNSNNDDDYNYFSLYGRINKNNYKRQHSQHIEDDNTTDDNNSGGDDDTAINRANGHNKPATKRYHGRVIKDGEETDPWPTSALSSPSSLAANSDEIQPDIIPYPPPPFTANKQTNNIGNQKHSGATNNYSNNGRQQQQQLHSATQTAHSVNDKFQIERAKQKAQQQQYFYEQWLLQQRQQERQQSLFEQLLGT